jgi:hypothetical protein
LLPDIHHSRLLIFIDPQFHAIESSEESTNWLTSADDTSVGALKATFRKDLKGILFSIQTVYRS